MLLKSYGPLRSRGLPPVLVILSLEIVPALAMPGGRLHHYNVGYCDGVDIQSLKLYLVQTVKLYFISGIHFMCYHINSVSCIHQCICLLLEFMVTL